MNIRTQAIGMSSQVQNVANLVCQQFFPLFLNNEGFYAFYMFAGINFLLVVFVWFCVPETKGVPLEEIDTLFGGANHAVKGADLIGVDTHSVSATAGEKRADERIEEVPRTPEIAAIKN
jgi:hypothetical protein